MLNPNTLFYIFSLLLLFCAIMVILVKHPMFSLLFLVSSFILASFILFMFECEFLALLFIIIYVGAVAILFLFAIMMLETKLTNLSGNIVKHLPIGFFFSFMLLVPLIFETNSQFNSSTIYTDTSLYLNRNENYYGLVETTSDIEGYGELLYTYFVLQFLVAGLILLVVLIGVVYLTNHYNVNQQRLDQTAFKQLAREAKFF